MKNNLKEDFERFSASTPEGKYLLQRGEDLYNDILKENEIREKNVKYFKEQLLEIPQEMGINLKMVNYPHTQWMLGQLTAKLTRIANTTDITEEEKKFKLASEMLIPMAPDVGTSTNLNPAMDGKIYGSVVVDDFETELEVKDTKLPDLVPGTEFSDRYLRFDIAEGNVMSCLGSYGKMRDILGIPLMPLMTVYDFFIKRAHDQYFYDLYWGSSFLLGGTPAGVTLSPEGAQHGWKSDYQIPNQITWEPTFCLELDWIFVDAIKRHLSYNNEGRNGVLIRGVTRGIDQKLLLERLKRHSKNKQDPTQKLCMSGFEMENSINEEQIACVDETQILNQLRNDVLMGGYYLIDYRNYAGYEPGDNVVHIFCMGALTPEAIKASDLLMEKGIYANVIVVTSNDLLIGNLAHENDYHHLKVNLQLTGELYLHPYKNGSPDPAEIKTLAGRRIPIVSVHDGEPGLLDNIGSIIGVIHESLCVRKHSKCGTPKDVYNYHHLDEKSIFEACGKVLSQVAVEKIQINHRALEKDLESSITDWKQVWPTYKN